MLYGKIEVYVLGSHFFAFFLIFLLIKKLSAELAMYYKS